MTPLETAYHNECSKVRALNALRVSTMSAAITLASIATIIATMMVVCSMRGYRVDSLYGHSMNPTMYEGDAAVIDENVSITDLECGDIITFERKATNESIIHRVHRTLVNDDGVMTGVETKGDNNEMTDAAITDDDNLTGRMILRLPRMAWLIRSQNAITICTVALVVDAMAFVIGVMYNSHVEKLDAITVTYNQFCYNQFMMQQR